MKKRSGVDSGYANCYGCSWSTEGRNACGNGAQHAKRTGHKVIATQVILTSFNYDAEVAS